MSARKPGPASRQTSHQATKQAPASDSGQPVPRIAHETKPAPGQPGYGSVVDRRSGIDRRDVALMKARTRAEKLRAAKLEPGATPDPDAIATNEPTDEDLERLVEGLERRRGPGRRLSDFTRAAEEGELTQEQFLFVMAIESFKRANETMFPTWCDVLEVVRLLGYRKTMSSEIALRNAEDWRESPLSPSNVRPPRWAEHGRTDAQRAAQRGTSERRTGAQQDRRAA